MKTILSVIRKEFIQIFRDKNMLKIIMMVPIIQTLILGFAITNDVRHIKLMIADLDHSDYSQKFADQFKNTDRFDIIGYTEDQFEIHKNIRKWKINAGIIIPKGFSKDLATKNKADIMVVFDAVDGNSAGIAMSYIANISKRFSLKNGFINQPVEVKERNWYNPDLNTYQYMVPGIVAVLVTIISMMLSSMALVKEKEIGTLEQLMVTPIKKHELLIGKLIPFLVLTIILFFISLAVGQLVFNIRMTGSYLLLVLLTSLYLFTTLGLGVSISIVSSSQQQAMFFSWFIMLFMVLLSGLFIPIDNMPEGIKILTLLNPMRYFVSIMREVFQKANTFSNMYKEIIPMTIYGIIIFTTGILGFKKRVS